MLIFELDSGVLADNSKSRFGRRRPYMLGGVFSDLSLAFKDSFDAVAGVAYSLVVVSFYYHRAILSKG